MFYNRKKTLRRFELKDEGIAHFYREGSQRNSGHFHLHHTDMKQPATPDVVREFQSIREKRVLVVGSFIIGLDIDEPGIGKHIAEVARQYGMDNLNVLFLTPLPGTRLWDKIKSEDRIALDTFPEDWK